MTRCTSTFRRRRGDAQQAGYVGLVSSPAHLACSKAETELIFVCCTLPGSLMLSPCSACTVYTPQWQGMGVKKDGQGRGKGGRQLPFLQETRRSRQERHQVRMLSHRGCRAWGCASTARALPIMPWHVPFALGHFIGPQTGD